MAGRLDGPIGSFSCRPQTASTSGVASTNSAAVTRSCQTDAFSSTARVLPPLPNTVTLPASSRTAMSRAQAANGPIWHPFYVVTRTRIVLPGIQPEVFAPPAGFEPSLALGALTAFVVLPGARLGTPGSLRRLGHSF